LLFAAGGFTPSHREIADLVSEYGIARRNVLRRHGPDRTKHIESVFSPSVLSSLRAPFANFEKRSIQRDEILWSGGYWDQLHRKFNKSATDSEKQSWRQEYLPAATELLGSVFCSSVEALISQRANNADFRLTLHRVIVVGRQCWLQQTCKYFGNTSRIGEKGRTFRVNEGIIGLAYRSRAICRTSVGMRKPQKGAVVRDAKHLGVGTDAQKMKPAVQSLLAVPMLASNRVCCVLFADSTMASLFEDDLLLSIVAVASQFLRLVTVDWAIPNIRNYGFSPPKISSGGRLRRLKLEAIEVLRDSRHAVPHSDREFFLNYELLNP
jgi:hypothetical protein